MFNLPTHQRRSSSSPRLTDKQLIQLLDLSKGSKITKLEPPFEDSTHDVYIIQDTDASSPSSVAKVLRANSLKNNQFWQFMNDCFNAGLIAQIACFYAIYPLIKEISPLTIPTLTRQIIDPAMPDEADKISLYLTQTHYLNANPVENITAEMVQDLAKHMACLHLSVSNHFGTVDEPLAPSLHDWPSHLSRVMTKYMEKFPEIPAYTREHLLKQIKDNFDTETFCLIMPDLRWDQFLAKGKHLFSLTDLDAIVYGPKELDWVILEYLLTPSQAEIFLQEYTQFLSVPDLTDVREVYRALLYMMNILGSKDFEAWMKQPKIFNRLNY